MATAQLSSPSYRISSSNASSGENTTIIHAHLHARELAMGRMQQEAVALGAHGVIGVRLTTRGYEWGPDLLEFSAIGTAVRLEGSPPTKQPFLSDLSGEDFWTLVQAGYLPMGLVMGFSAYVDFLSSYGGGNWLGFNNQEVPEFSRAVYRARANAMQRLGAEVRRLGADGAVGVKVEIEKHFERGDDNVPAHLRVDFFVLGTAIVQVEMKQTRAQTRPVLNMTGLQPVRARLEGAELQSG